MEAKLCRHSLVADVILLIFKVHLVELIELPTEKNERLVQIGATQQIRG